MRAFISFFIGIIALVATHDLRAQSASAKATADRLDPAAAVRAANNRFAGVWKLVGEETRDAKGEIVPGPNAKSGGRVGYIVYDPAGYMSVNLAWLSRPELAGRQPTPDEARVAMGTYNSYWGSP
jgi:lipocalin-like protein